MGVDRPRKDSLETDCGAGTNLAESKINERSLVKRRIMKAALSASPKTDTYTYSLVGQPRDKENNFLHVNILL